MPETNGGSRGGSDRSPSKRPASRSGHSGGSGAGGKGSGSSGAGGKGSGSSGSGGKGSGSGYGKSSGRPQSSGGGRSGGGRSGAPAGSERRPRPGASASRATPTPVVRTPVGPPIDPDVTGSELAPEVRRDLRSLAKDKADDVGQRLVMVARLLDSDPETALKHADVARELASRVGSVREACGLAAYATGDYAAALRELRAARRITGSSVHLPVMADCERGLGRPDRALALAHSDDVKALDADARIEMTIVESGARRDRGEDAAALAVLDSATLRTSKRPWAARLRYAYADLLLDLGRRDEAIEWFRRTAASDTDHLTDAADRLVDLDGVTFVDVDESAES